MPKDKAPVVCLISGVFIIVVGIAIYLFLADIGKNKGAAWLIIAIGIIFVAIGVIWLIIVKKDENAKEEKANSLEAR